MCAWKYPQGWFNNGDILEPSDWRINQQEFLGEANGRLDNDNLYTSMLDHSHFNRGTFNTFYKSPYQQVLIEHDQGGWQDSNSSGVLLPNLMVESSEDGLVIVDANVEIYWTNAESFLWDDGGPEKIVYYSYWRPPSVRSQAFSAYVLCVMFRLTCDGLAISETGPIGNEYQNQHVYLCGSLPISAGKSKIKLEARFVWYSPGKDKYIEASAQNPDNKHKNGQETGENIRQACRLKGKLIVNHRKR